MDNTTYKTEEILRQEWEYVRQEDGTLCLKAYRGEDEDLVIPGYIGSDRVTKIGYRDNSGWHSTAVPVFDRFYKFKLRSVVIQEGITQIGENVFAWCTELKSVQLPDSLTQIGSSAFSKCKALEEIRFPRNLKEIGSGAFENCIALKHAEGIPQECHLNGTEFVNCPGLVNRNGFVIINGVLYCYVGTDADVTVPEGVKIIAANVFQGNKVLENITLSKELTRIGSEAFKDCSSLKSIIFPECITRLEGFTFTGCYRLAKIVGPWVFEVWDEDWIPARCCVLPRFDFTTAKKMKFKIALLRGFLEHPELYNAERTAMYTKFLCEKRKNVLPELLKEDNVAAITLLAENEKINAKNYDIDFFEPAVAAEANQCVAFLLDWKNKNIANEPRKTALKLEETIPAEQTREKPAPLDEIKKLWAFSKNPDGTFTITGYKGTQKNVTVPAVIGGQRVTQIDKKCFSRSKSGLSADQKKFLKNGLKSVVIPEGVTYIGKEVFFDCAGLSKVSIPNSVTVIDEKAFSKCTGLKNIDIPAGVTTIGTCAFANCKGLESIVLPASARNLGSGIWSDCEKLSNVTLANGIQVIPMATFQGCRKLKHIEIPDSVTELGKDAFGFSGLEEITIPASVTAIADGIFSGCEALKEIVIPDTVTNFDSSFAFHYCSGLLSVKLPGNLHTIGYGTFDGCSKLTQIDLPESLEEIGDHAFADCSKLRSLVIPQTVTKIGEMAFARCTELKSIKIPAGVTELKQAAFVRCGKLQKVSLPMGLTRVGKKAFAGCGLLSSIHLPETISYMEENVFTECNQITIHARAGSFAEIYAKDCNIPFVAE